MNLRTYRYDALLYVCNRVVAYFPGSRLRHFFYRRAMKIEIAPSAFLMSGIWFDTRGNCSVGKNSVINQGCRLDNRGGIRIDENVSISPEVHLITADHDVESPTCAGRHAPILIEKLAFIGSRATILPGVTIGEGAVVAACACVTKDVEPYSVVGGVPAREIRKRNRNLEYETGYQRHFL
jgi:acetyltransferase-like isoleucine patch superfamily enzyme